MIYGEASFKFLLLTSSSDPDIQFCQSISQGTITPFIQRKTPKHSSPQKDFHEKNIFFTTFMSTISCYGTNQ